MKWCWRKWCRGHGSGVDCGKILIETYLKGDQIRLDCGGSGDRGCGIDAGIDIYYYYLTGTDWEVMWLGVGLREGDWINF